MLLQTGARPGRELAFFDYVVRFGVICGWVLVMTPAGTFELPLLAVQVLTSIAAAWAGIRVVDDIRHFKALRQRRAARD